MKIDFKALGTDISVQIVSDDVSLGFEKEIKNFYQEKEKIFSRFLEKSELGQLNKNLGRYNKASSDIIEVAEKCLEYNKVTGGYFDPRVIEVLENIGYDRNFKDIDTRISANQTAEPLRNNLFDDLKIKKKEIYFGQRMDFSGIAKGYITDRIAKYLEKEGYQNFLVDSGGDIRVSGKDEKGENWKISLESVAEEKLIIELDNNFSAVATSGITRKKWAKGDKKYHHLINPKDPSDFSFDLKSVTVVAKTCEETDVWAKVLFLMGREKGIKFSEDKNIKSLFLDYKGSLYISSKIKQSLII
jgi:FAD:protein FMN transferase